MKTRTTCLLLFALTLTLPARAPAQTPGQLMERPGAAVAPPLDIQCAFKFYHVADDNERQTIRETIESFAQERRVTEDAGNDGRGDFRLYRFVVASLDKLRELKQNLSFRTVSQGDKTTINELYEEFDPTYATNFQTVTIKGTLEVIVHFTINPPGATLFYSLRPGHEEEVARGNIDGAGHVTLPVRISRNQQYVYARTESGQVQRYLRIDIETGVAESISKEQFTQRRAGPGGAPAPVAPAPLPTVAQKNLRVDLGGGVTMEFVLIRPGNFTMGSDAGADEQPAHKVTISKPFYLGKFEVTQEQWEKVMGSNPSNFKGAKNPVDTVSWNDCQSFVAKLNEKVPGTTFALPTEAQWEYACRAGSTTDPSNFDEVAWYSDNSGSQTHPVGEKKPNAWGLYDMHGNVWEWCQDWYGSYDSNAATDPVGPSSGSYRVLRGGSWTSLPRLAGPPPASTSIRRIGTTTSACGLL